MTQTWIMVDDTNINEDLWDIADSMDWIRDLTPEEEVVHGAWSIAIDSNIYPFIRETPVPWNEWFLEQIRRGQDEGLIGQGGDSIEDFTDRQAEAEEDEDEDPPPLYENSYLPLFNNVLLDIVGFPPPY